MSQRRVAMAGLGSMGTAMALRLAESGFDVTAWNRTPGHAQSVAAAGVRAVATAAEAAAAAPVVLISLSDENAVEDVLFGRMAGALAPGTVVADTSTVSPEYARRAWQRLSAGGVRRMDACLIGNPAMARQGKLRILTAGDPADMASVRDVLSVLGPDVRHIGRPGQAAVLKLAFNLVLAAQVASLAEAAALGDAAGLDRDTVLAAISESGFSSKVMSFRSGIMRQRAYEPAAFRSALMHKDLCLAAGAAARHGVRLPLTACTAELFGAAVAAGDGDKDAAVIAEHAGRTTAGSLSE